MQGELVPLHAEPGDHADRRGGEHGVPALRLARVHVRDVHLDERDRDADERIAQREARVRVRAGIDDRRVHPAAHRVHGVHELALAVALHALDLGAVLATAIAAEPGIIGLTAPPGPGPRLQDLVTDDRLEVTVHAGFDWWLADVEEREDLAPALEQANVILRYFLGTHRRFISSFWRFGRLWF